jgi:RecA-family ATPase
MSGRKVPLQAGLEPEKLLPNNVEAERAVLGSILIHPVAITKVADILRADDFYVNSHRVIYQAIIDLCESREPADLITLTDELQRRGKLEEIGGVSYVSSLANQVPTSANAEYYAGIVLRAAIQRRLIDAAGQIAKAAYETPDADAALEQAEKLVSSISERAARARPMLNLAQLMATPLEPLRYVVPTFLPEGLAILAAKGKIGKSWLAYALAIAVASGGVFLGQRVEAGDVLYLALEDGERRLQSRARKLLGDSASWPQRLELATKWARLDAGGLRRLEWWLKDHPTARLIVVDVFAKVKPPRSRYGDPYAEDYAAMEGLHALAQAYRVAIVVIHHTRKAGAEDVYDELNGTSGLAGAADTLLVLQRPRDEAEGVLHLTGREIEDETSHVLRFSRETCTWQLAEDQDTDPLLSQEAADVLRILRDADGPMTPDAVSEALGIAKTDFKARGAVRQRLSRMERRGQIAGAGFGRYKSGSQHVSKSLSHLSHLPDVEPPDAGANRLGGVSPSVTPHAAPVTLPAQSVTPPVKPVTLADALQSRSHADSEHVEASSVTGVTGSHTVAQSNGHAPISLKERLAQLAAEGITGDAAVRRALIERGSLTRGGGEAV